MSAAEMESTASGAGSRIAARVWGYAAIVTLVCVAYGPAFGAGFIWNDVDYVTAPHLRTLGGLWRIWFQLGATEQYYPLLHSAFWLQHWAWGDAAAGYHVFNVMLHATSACLLVELLRRLAIPGAVWAGLVFALHPVCVESVAWISEEKNTLSLVFYLGAALAYLRFEAQRTRAAYVTASVLFAMALLTKSVTATLPAALLVLAWWRRGTLRWRNDIVPLLPWLVCGAAFGLFSAWVERHYIGAEGNDFNLSLLDRLALAGRIIWFYVAKTFWPANLVFIYPRWQIDARQVGQWIYFVAALVVSVGLLLAWRRTRGPIASWLLFLGTLFPTIGFFNVYAFKFSFVADHWQYLPSIALIAFATGGVATATARWPPRPRPVARAVLVCLVAGLTLLTWRQCRPYRDLETFYRAIIDRNPAAWLAHNNLGLHLVETGRVAESLPYFEAALRARPGHEETEANYGGALIKLGRNAEAAPHLEAALRSEVLRHRPSYAALQANWAAVLLDQNRVGEAEPYLLSALQTKPNLAEAWNILGLVYAREQKGADARRAYDQALKVRPQFASAHLNLAQLLAGRGDFAEAASHYEAGIAAGPIPLQARRDYATVLLRLHRAHEAVPQLKEVVAAAPDDGVARAQLGVALAESGRLSEGVAESEEAARRAPGNRLVERIRDQLRALQSHSAPP